MGRIQGAPEGSQVLRVQPVHESDGKTGCRQVRIRQTGSPARGVEPEISPALKTIYGYDAEGHVTALTSARPGESWAFTYGTIAGDREHGAAAEGHAGPCLGEIVERSSAEKHRAPKLSGLPVVGVTMGVSNGVWSNEPVAYAYQWEDCNSEGKECTPIPGRDQRKTIRPVAGDVGHRCARRLAPRTVAGR